MKKAVALLLAICFFIPVSKAGAASLAPMLDGWLSWVRNGGAADVTMSATLHSLSPYGEQTLTAMNSLLAKCKLQVGYQQGKQGENTQARLIIGDVYAVDFRELSGNQTLAQTSLLPGLTLASAKGSPLQLLVGKQADIPSWADGIPDLNALSQRIPDVLAGLKAYAQEKQVSFKIASVGTAKKALVYTVPREGAQAFKDGLSILLSGLNMPGVTSQWNALVISGDAVITLYQAAGGENMALGVKAAMGVEDAAPRNVNFLWGFTGGEKKSVHTISLNAPAEKGQDNLTAEGEMVLQYSEKKNSLTLSLDIKSKQGSRSEKTNWSGRLDCLLAEDNQRLEGEIRRTYTDPEGTDHILTIKPSLLALMAGNELSIKGSVRVLWAIEKSTQADVEFSVLACSAGDLPWENTPDTISLDSLSGDELKAMSEKAQMAAVGAIWRAVMTLPQECLTLISQNITQEDWERIYRDAYQAGQ